MLNDKYGGAHSTANHEAITAFEAAIYAVAAHRPLGEALQRTLKMDDDFVAAHALYGFGNVILARHETVGTARAIFPVAKQKLEKCGGGTPSERALVEALGLAIDGKLQASASRLELHLDVHPCDFLALKISHALRFMSGQSSQMIAVTRRLLPSWSADDAAYGFVLGCHAFGLEETGQFVAAERFGREAHKHECADAWGLHAVSHVMEMSRRTDDGIAWLEETRRDWSACNNFSYHIGWHLALFRLEQRRIDDVLDVYDRDIRPTASDDFRDIANATSILWRLEMEGVPVGHRWDELHALSVSRRSDMTYVFGSLHYLLALVAADNMSGATDLLRELRTISTDATHDQAMVAADVGVPLAETIIAMAHNRPLRADLVRLANKLHAVGGSHAQRDVFLRTLLMAAAEAGDAPSVLVISRMRHAVRSSDRFMSLVAKRLDENRDMRRVASTAHRAS